MQVYLGIDWSRYKHDALFMNDAGEAVAHLVLGHDLEGFRRLEAMRAKLGVSPGECVVGLETAHNLLLDFLWDREYHQVYVVPPHVVKSNRSRFRQSGAQSDPSDAFVVADMLRTDRGRLYPWFPDSGLTRQIRAKVSLVLHLTQSIVRLSNRLRDVLWRYYPGLLPVFANLTSNITLAFVQAYPTPQAAAELTWEAFERFAHSQRYFHRRRLARGFAQLQAQQPPVDPATVAAYQEEAQLLARLLQQSLQAKKKVLRELTALFDQHPDAALFRSLPGAGDLLAPALLAKFGDDRRRFPAQESVQALAGTCPVTKSSGRWRTVHFRYACDREFRYVAQQWAICSLRQSAWANSYLQRVLPHCRSLSHAYRCLANRWLGVAWKVWHARTPYDEAFHLKQVALRRQPRG